MRLPVRGTRLLTLVPLATMLVAGLVALSGVPEPARADPPSTPSAIPADAFRPVTLPDERAPADPEPTRDAARVPDGGIPESSPDPSAAATVEPSPPSGPEHVVRPGDTLWQIAAWHRADLQLILRWNEGLDPRRLVNGQRILVPGGGPMPSPRPAAPVVRAAGPAPSVTGTHLWPLPVRGRITTRFSARHPGIDIAAPAGTPVRAIAGGTVTWAGWKNNGGGYVVVLRHPDGMTSTYNHNREVSVAVGQVVAAGDQIASVGATGWATGPHLDLRIEMGGRLIDPLAVY